MNSAIEAICRKIDEQPEYENDLSLLGILGDALEDIGNRKSDGIRWLVKNEKAPYCFQHLHLTPKYFAWCPERENNKNWHPSLPREMIDLMKNDSEDWRDYPTLSSAMLAAAEAYVLFKDSEQHD